MGTRKTALTPQEVAKIENIATSEKFRGTDTERAFLFFRYCGAHVAGLYAPQSKLHEEMLREEGDEQDTRYIVWNRPMKKDGKWKRTVMPKNAHINFNVEDWYKDIQQRNKKKSRQYWYDLMKRLGERAGIPSVSPNSFRHTLTRELINLKMDLPQVCQILNCSLRTLERHYGLTSQKSINQRLKDVGWL